MKPRANRLRPKRCKCGLRPLVYKVMLWIDYGHAIQCPPCRKIIIRLERSDAVADWNKAQT